MEELETAAMSFPRCTNEAATAKAAAAAAAERLGARGLVSSLRLRDV